MNTATKITLGALGLGLLYAIVSVNTDVPKVEQPKPEPNPQPSVKPKPTPVKVIDPVQKPASNTRYFNAKADAQAVALYKSVSDYPAKPYLTLPVGKKTRNPLGYKGSQVFVYTTGGQLSTVSVTLDQVSIPGMNTPVYVQSYLLSTN